MNTAAALARLIFVLFMPTTFWPSAAEADARGALPDLTGRYGLERFEDRLVRQLETLSPTSPYNPVLEITGGWLDVRLCNRLSGPYRVSDGKLHAELSMPDAEHRHTCHRQWQRAETRLRRMLAGGAPVEHTGGGLDLKDEAGKTVFRFYLDHSPAPALRLPEPGWTYRVASMPEDAHVPVHLHPQTDSPVAGILAPETAGVLMTGVWQTAPGGEIWWEALLPDSEAGVGWVKPLYLVPEDPKSASPDTLHRPRQAGYPLACGGTEPFWGLHIAGDQAVFSTPGGRPDGPPIERVEWKAGPRHGGYGFAVTIPLADAQSGAQGWAAIRKHSQQACSDGMSDNLYPFEITLISPDGNVAYGCCRRARY